MSVTALAKESANSQSNLLLSKKRNMSSISFYEEHIAHSSGTHLIVFVHGLLGSSFDLRQYKNRVMAALNDLNFKNLKHEYLLSCCNEDDTFEDIEILAERLVTEIFDFLSQKSKSIDKIRFETTFYF
jgi:hypothetical protein